MPSWGMGPRGRRGPGGQEMTANGLPSVRLLVPASALLWGLQFAFLNPAIGIILVTLYDATPDEVGLALAAYNVSGFVSTLVVPTRADRSGEYLVPMLWCGVFTVALTTALALSTSLPPAVLALVALGGPAGVGIGLLFRTPAILRRRRARGDAHPGSVLVLVGGRSAARGLPHGLARQRFGPVGDRRGGPVGHDGHRRHDPRASPRHTSAHHCRRAQRQARRRVPSWGPSRC